MKLTPFIRNILWATPLYFMSLLPFIFLAPILKIDINYTHVLLGALGWWVALLLRLPIILILKKKNINLKTSNKITVGLSGPSEEVTRLILLSIIGVISTNAYSIGIGWAMIEIIYGLVQIIGLGVLDQKHDPKAEEAKTIMKQMGMDKTLEPSTPFWGALERVSASALHIGFSLLLIVSPYILIITIPLHSFINFYVVKMNKTSIRKSQIGLLLMGCLVFIISLIIT